MEICLRELQGIVILPEIIYTELSGEGLETVWRCLWRGQ